MKVLLIGYGSIGKRHVRILENLPAVEKIDIVTRQDIKDHAVFRSLHDIKNINEYDYFIISSETYKHYEQLEFLNKNVKGKKILVEKPVFMEYHEIKPDNNIFVGYNLRFHPVLQKIRNEIKEKKILFVNVIAGMYLPSWRPDRDYRDSYSADKAKGGGVLLDLSHEIDYIQWLFGEIKTISGINSKISDLEINSDDIAAAVGITDQNVIVNFSMDYVSKIPIRNILIHSDEETIIGDLINKKITISAVGASNSEETFSDVERNFTYTEMHKAIINNDLTDLCNIQEGLKVLKTIEKVKKSTIK